MKLRSVTVLLLSALLSFGSNAETLTLKKDYPKQYIVKKGDTLWDISGRFLTKPWLWPRLWNMNRQIKDPHWIYPGDIIHLIWVNGQPRLSLDRGGMAGKKVIKISPRIRTEEQVKPIPTVEYDELAPFLQADVVADTDYDIQHAPYVLGENDDQSLVMSQGQNIHVRGKLKEGMRYGVYHVGDTYKDKNTKEALGRPLELLGIVEPVSSYDGDISEAEVVTSYNGIHQGDRVLPLLEESSVDAFFSPEPGELSQPGEIIDVPQKTTYVGRFDTVIINKGQRENLKPGDVFAIVQPGAKVVDHGPSDVTYEDRTGMGKKIMDKKNTRLQGDHIGEVMVVKVYSKTSLAIVMNSRALVHTGYAIENP